MNTVLLSHLLHEYLDDHLALESFDYTHSQGFFWKEYIFWTGQGMRPFVLFPLNHNYSP